MRAESMKQAHTNFLQALITAEVLHIFQDWEVQRSKNAMFKSMMKYLHRVKTILFFVAESRNAGEDLSKMFFSMDRFKYKRIWPQYIADIYDLRINHPNTWRKLETGIYP